MKRKILVLMLLITLLCTQLSSVVWAVNESNVDENVEVEETAENIEEENIEKQEELETNIDNSDENTEIEFLLHIELIFKI